MNLPIKLISTDFDGTLHAEFENPPVPPMLQAMIGDLQQKGAKWVINTGRDLSSLMETMGRSHLTIKPDYLVTVEREIYVHEGQRYIGLEEWNHQCTRVHEQLFAAVRKDIPELMAWVNAHFPATVYEDQYSPFCLIAENNEDTDAIEAHLLEYCERIPGLTCVRNDVYARFCHVSYNKGTALSQIARLLGLTPVDVLAAGDHFNDLPMLTLEHARWLVAPANAISEVKDAVRRQNGYVSHQPFGHGVARGLEYWIETIGRGG
jgi:HAD superfamily hydrolase (TIGR01484 family)